MKSETKICSIFGQIESVVADAMIEEGKLNRIEPAMIPETAAHDEHGRSAKFAVVVPAIYRAEFERRIAALRS